MGMETEEDAFIALTQKASKQKTKDNHKKKTTTTDRRGMERVAERHLCSTWKDVNNQMNVGEMRSLLVITDDVNISQRRCKPGSDQKKPQIFSI